MKYLLEYSESQGCFHYNYKETTGQFHNELFVNGYRPITIIDEETLNEGDDAILYSIMDRAMREKYPYEKAAGEILFFLMSQKN